MERGMCFSGLGQSIPGEAGSLEDAGWSNQGQSCLYSLPEGMAIFAGSSIMVRLQVNNPSLPRQREDVMNTWFLGLRSSGSSMSFRNLNLSAFDLATELGANYSSSRSILGVITDATIQPLMQQPTLPFLQPAEQSFTAVQIFFRPSQDVLAGGAVLVQAAPGFSFGTCQSSDLPASSHYYFDYSSGTQSTSPLPQLSCETSSNSPFHALIRLKSRIFASQMYAWQITVRMPPVDLYDENYGWYLYTQTAAGSLVDGTTTAVPAANRDVFKLYHRSLVILWCDRNNLVTFGTMTVSLPTNNTFTFLQVKYHIPKPLAPNKLYGPPINRCWLGGKRYLSIGILGSEANTHPWKRA